MLEIPIFPLPNVVFFPHTVLPLHIFEPRYRQMVQDALDAEKRIGMNLLKPGWEQSYHENPAIFPTGSVGRIAQHQRLEGGKYNIILEGLSRYQVLHFIRQTPYRVARVQLLDESVAADTETREMTTELLLSFLELSGDEYSEATQEHLERLDAVQLVNAVCSAVDLSVQEKQRLLETEVRGRTSAVLSILKQQVKHRRFVSTFEHLRPERPNHN